MRKGNALFLAMEGIRVTFQQNISLWYIVILGLANDDFKGLGWK